MKGSKELGLVEQGRLPLNLRILTDNGAFCAPNVFVKVLLKLQQSISLVILE
jgi:hypothetical protein